MEYEFSIIIPTYNSEEYLNQTLDSIKKQDQRIEIECIFSDGGSKDKTISIIDKFEQNNISKILVKDQLGLSKALNTGFKLAKGKYLTYLNSDDLLAENSLITIKKNFEINKNHEWLIGLCENIGEKSFLNKFVNFYKHKLLKSINFNLLCINNVISQPSVFWRKSFFQEIGKFNEKLNYNMDYDMWLRMLKVSKPLKLENKLSYFRRHKSSLSHKNLIKQFLEKYKTMKFHNKNIIISFLHICISFMIVSIYKITKY